MECKIHCWNARGEISRMAVSMELHGYHGMVRSRFSRDPSPASWAQRGQISALGLLGAPLIAMRCSTIAPEHFATIGGHVGSAAGDPAWRLPSPCPWARPQPPTRHSSACWGAPGSALCAAISAAHICTIAEIFVRLGAAAGGGSKLSGIQQLPAGRQEDLRPQLHQLALAWHAGKGTKDELSSTDHPAPFAAIMAKISHFTERMRTSRQLQISSLELNLSR